MKHEKIFQSHIRIKDFEIELVIPSFSLGQAEILTNKKLIAEIKREHI